MPDNKKLSHSTLAKLSGLSRQQLDEFMPTWSALADTERRRAVRTLIDLAEDNVELDFGDLFRRLVADPDPEVRSLSLEGLWEDDRPSTADLQIRIVHEDPDGRVRAAAVDGLGRFALRMALEELRPQVAERVRAALLDLVGPGTPIDLRRRAVEAAGYLGSEPPFRAVIQAAYGATDLNLRASAVRAMGRSCDTTWRNTILAELKGEEPMIRYEAARAAGEMAEETFIPPLTDALEDEDTEVRLAAIQALAAIGGQRARQVLMRLRQGRDEVLADAAEAALEELDTIEDPVGIRVREINPN